MRTHCLAAAWHTQLGNFGTSSAFGRLSFFLQQVKWKNVINQNQILLFRSPFSLSWYLKREMKRTEKVQRLLCHKTLSLNNKLGVKTPPDWRWTLWFIFLPLAPLGFLPLHHQNPYKSFSFCVHVCQASHPPLPDSPLFPLEMICGKEQFVFWCKNNKKGNKLTNKQKKNPEPTDVSFLPATGGLGTNGATELALKEGIQGNTSTTGPASWQLPICTCTCACVCAWANFNTGTHLYTGALHTGALL